MIVPLPRALKHGDSGRDVLMLKRALSRAHYRKWGRGFTKGFGAELVNDVKRFQRDHGLKADGVYGPTTHKKLARFYDHYGASVMLRLVPQQPEEVSQALIAYNNRNLVRYTQTSLRMMIVRNKIKDLRKWFTKNQILWEDCSSFVTGLYYIAGRKDPNGYSPGYPGYGYTGTLAVHGKRVSFPKLGDLALYGGFPYKHTTICVGFKNSVPSVVSQGSDAGPLLSPFNYRSDFSHWRNYGR